MFQGKIPVDMRQVLAEHLEGLGGRPLSVGCSGDFTIERQAHAMGFGEIRSCDINVNSCVVGSWLAGKHLDLALKEGAEWLEPYHQTQTGKVANVLLLSTMGQLAKGKSAYDVRMRRAYTSKWADLHAKTVDKLERSRTRLADFDTQDVVSWADGRPRSDGFVSFPPFWVGDGKSLYAEVLRSMHWTPPERTAAPSLDSLGEASVEWQTLSLLFLPDEIERLSKACDQAVKLASGEKWAFRLAEYRRFMDAVSTVQGSATIRNMAVALTIILDVFERNVGQLNEHWFSDAAETQKKSGNIPLHVLFERGDVHVRVATKVRKQLVRGMKAGKLQSTDLPKWLEQAADLMERKND